MNHDVWTWDAYLLCYLHIFQRWSCTEVITNRQGDTIQFQHELGWARVDAGSNGYSSIIIFEMSWTHIFHCWMSAGVFTWASWVSTIHRNGTGYAESHQCHPWIHEVPFGWPSESGSSADLMPSTCFDKMSIHHGMHDCCLDTWRSFCVQDTSRVLARGLSQSKLFKTATQ